LVKSKNVVAAGASNGGLLIGMMLSKFPEHLVGLSSELGLTDLELMETLSMGPAWTAEYPHSLEGRIKISPCHQISPSPVNHPPILIFTNTRDDVIHPAHSRRYTYLLQEAGFEARFIEIEGGGHGYDANYQGSARFFALRQSFFRDSLKDSDVDTFEPWIAKQ
jgi:prolyl oligopeptidase